MKPKKLFNNIEVDGDSLWVDIKKHTVHLKRTDEGVVVDIFMKPKKGEEFDDPIASTYAFDNE